MLSRCWPPFSGRYMRAAAAEVTQLRWWGGGMALLEAPNLLRKEPETPGQAVTARFSPAPQCGLPKVLTEGRGQAGLLVAKLGESSP